MDSTRATLLRLFVFALALRWAYDVALFLTMGREGLMGADSRGYLTLAHEFAAAARGGSLSGWQWLGPDLPVMPLSSWLLTANMLLFGELVPLTYVMSQGIIDAGTCLLIYGIACGFDDRYAYPAAVAAAINPTQIVLSGLIYIDTPFVFFVALFLFGAIRWLALPSWRYAILIGVGLGGAALVRVLIVPWVAVLMGLLLLVCVLRRKFRLQYVGHVAAASIVFGVLVAPILARNVTQYGAWAFTPQTGAHVSYWIVPLVREAKDGTPWAHGAKQMSVRVKKRLGDRKSSNPFETSTLVAEIGWQELRGLGPSAVIKAWIFGAAINLGSPAVILSPPIARLPRTGFYGTEGHSLTDKVFNFLFRSDNAAYAWALLVGLAGVAILRAVQLCGLGALLAGLSNPAGLLLLLMWIGFVLAVNGPVASPKYRLPIEPALMVLTGAGFCALRDWRRQRR